MIKSHPLNRIILLLTFGVFFATSCEEPVDLDIAIQEPQIVVTSNFAPGEPFKVTVTKSKNLLTNEADEFVNNAVVRIFSSQGKELDKLPLNNFHTPFYESKRIVPESGKAYRLQVEVPGKETILAEDIVPLPVALTAIEMDTIEIFGETAEQIYKVSIAVHFTDPIGAQDYYHLSLFNHSEDSEEGTPMDGYNGTTGRTGASVLTPLMPLESDKNNPAVTFHFEDGGVLFTDEDFDGQKAALTFYSLLSFDNEAHQGKVVGELRTVSKDYYLYHTSLSRQIANKDRPFVEPISVYSNIENGLGIFSGYALYRDSVSITSSF
ncbi:MAG: DUF4249 domain-containing protein [Saprospiraceae bacterium]